jgi:hypothetical protein
VDRLTATTGLYDGPALLGDEEDVPAADAAALRGCAGHPGSIMTNNFFHAIGNYNERPI